MTIPLPYFDQYACRNETMEVYASDRRGTVAYQFNNFGYRNDIDYTTQDTDIGVYIGSSITAGIGVDWNKSFAYLTSQGLQTRTYHFAQGCKEVDNHEILRMLEAVKQVDLDAKYFVLQFINLDRIYDPATGITVHSQDHEQNIKRFVQDFDCICKILENHRWCFIGCDAHQHQLPERIIKHPRCVSWNTQYIDLAGVGTHPGPRWHKMISMGLVKHLKQAG
jgi:hypothetical protein